MFKKDFIDMIQEKVKDRFELSISKSSVEKIYDTIFESIEEIVNFDDALVIGGFGKFSLHITEQRDGINGFTGEKVIVPSKRQIKFKPSILIKQRLNQK
jgi:nucleoid DNA-binding protein